MLGAIYVGLSGMQAYSKGLLTISNNVANLNSPGFKATGVRFTDVASRGGDFLQGSQDGAVGSGVRFGDPTIDFKQGDLRQSDSDLDLAIQGGGFLVLKEGDKTVFARTGRFVIDTDGFITLEGSERRLTALDAGGVLVELNLNDKRTNSPVATTKVVFADNLSSTTPEAAVSNIEVFDSAGGKQVWKVTLKPTATPPTGDWTVTVTDQTGRTVKTAGLKFISGVIDPSTARITVTDAPAGAQPLSVELDFSSGVTSFSSGTASSLRASSTDGHGVGAVTSVTVTGEGQLKLTYSNSETLMMGSIALADFRNPQVLERVGDGLFELESEVDDMRLLTSGAEGVGKLVSRQIEASNIDLSQEFGDLILIQRGFQASSQVVSVSNDMIQQLFGIRGQG